MSFLTDLSVLTGETSALSCTALAIAIVIAIIVAAALHRIIGVAAGLAWAAVSLGLISASQLAGYIAEALGR